MFGKTIGRYLGELLGERHKLGPFVQILPNCIRLINQGLKILNVVSLSWRFVAQVTVFAEIRRASFNQNLERVEAESPLRLLGQNPYGRPMDLDGWSAMQIEVYILFILSRQLKHYGSFLSL